MRLTVNPQTNARSLSVATKAWLYFSHGRLIVNACIHEKREGLENSGVDATAAVRENGSHLHLTPVAMQVTFCLKDEDIAHVRKASPRFALTKYELHRRLRNGSSGVAVAQVGAPLSAVVVAADATSANGTSGQSEAAPAVPSTVVESTTARPAPATVKTDVLRAADKVRLRVPSAPTSRNAASQGKDGGSTDAPPDAQTTLNFEASTGTGSADA